MTNKKTKGNKARGKPVQGASKKPRQVPGKTPATGKKPAATAKGKQGSAAARGRQAQREKKEKRGKVWKRLGAALLAIVAVIVIGFAGFGIAYLATDGFGGSIRTIVVTTGDSVYTDDAVGLTMVSGTQFRVRSMTSDDAYAVKIEARAGEEDFAFTVGQEPYRWRDVDGKDMTRGFDIRQTEDGFEVRYQSLQSVIERAFGTDAEIAGTVPAGDLFVLVVAVGQSELRIGFHIDLSVTDVELDPDHIVIGK